MNNNKAVNTAPQAGTLAQIDLETLRSLHTQALSQAAAKQTELRLVVASRYKELCSVRLNSDGKQQGSYAELLSMLEDSKKLVELLNVEHDPSTNALATSNDATTTAQDEEKTATSLDAAQKVRNNNLTQFQRALSKLDQPRRTHSMMDSGNLYGAALSLLDAFRLISSFDGDNNNSMYKLASQYTASYYGSNDDLNKELGIIGSISKDCEGYDNVAYQVRLVYMHIMTLPKRIKAQARRTLLSSRQRDDNNGATACAGALAALVLLDRNMSSTNLTGTMMDLYFELKGRMLHSLVSDLQSHDDQPLEKLLNIVQVVQDLILDSYSIFVDGQYDCVTAEAKQSDDCTGAVLYQMLQAFPKFATLDMQESQVRLKCSRFLAAHLPLLKKKISGVLSSISNAALLGQIREALYKQTTSMDHTPEWQNSCRCLVDVRVVSTPVNSSATASLTSASNFALWSLLFSHTFDELVDNLLKDSFASLYSQVTSSLQRSLAAMPSHDSMRASDCHRNCCIIASVLDTSLQKLSDDAWKLVHQEQKEESSLSLRQSLFVQTCETMARLLANVRFLFEPPVRSENNETDDIYAGAKGLLIGRFCWLLKHRVRSLYVLLDQAAAPVYSSGMIAIDDLKTSFDIADTDDDGLLGVDNEIKEAIESAFSVASGGALGNQKREHVLRTIEMVRNNDSSTMHAVSFGELALLSARGLVYAQDSDGACGMIMSCLDKIIGECFGAWGKVVLNEHSGLLKDSIRLSRESWNVDEKEWQRLQNISKEDSEDVTVPRSVSSYIEAFFLGLSRDFVKAVCPTDALPPICDAVGTNESLAWLIRKALVGQSLSFLTQILNEEIVDPSGVILDKVSEPCLLQHMLDISFITRCYESRQILDKGADDSKVLSKILNDIEGRIDPVTLELIAHTMEKEVLVCSTVCTLYIDALFGEGKLDTQVASKQNMLDGKSEANVSSSLIPIQSSQRFLLLPIQSEKAFISSPSLTTENEFSSNLGSDNVSKAKQASLAKSGLGFLSSMLGK